MKNVPIRSLYISYFGLREPLVQTQVLPYLRTLSESGVDIWLMTFEPRMKTAWTGRDINEWRERLNGAGIRWIGLPYHKRPTLPATLFDIARGALTASRVKRKQKLDLFHARGYVPAAMAALAKWISGGRMIFDVRGLMPEEYVDAGVWPENGLLYRLTKRAEAKLINAADGFVVLTEKARGIIAGHAGARNKPVEVIPCCVDFDRFNAANVISKEAIRAELRIAEDRRVLVYAGALGGWYLTDEMARFIATAMRQDPKSYALIITQSDPAIITDRLKRAGVGARDFSVSRVAPERAPLYLKAADIALSFIKPCYSKLASSPTKIAEYLASGLPVVCNAGVGDLDELIEVNRVGVILSAFNSDAYIEALRKVEALSREDDFAARCRETARRQFDLQAVGAKRYRNLYERVMRNRSAGAAAYKAAL